jgi:hypothetical protein
MRSVWLALGLAACGDVNVIPDAAVPDAYQHDAPNDPMCMPGEMACSGLCADVMTSEQYCGNCGTSCAPNQGCISGTCMPRFTDCARVFASDPMSPSGVYTNPDNGQVFYCDMEAKAQYNNLSLTAWSATVPANYAMVRAADLTSAVGAKAFVALFNHVNGIPTLAAFTIGNCCMKVAAGTFLLLDANYILPYVCSSSMNGTYRFTELGVQVPSPLPGDFFTTNVPSEATHASCSDNANPMWIWQKRTF